MINTFDKEVIHKINLQIKSGKLLFTNNEHADRVYGKRNGHSGKRNPRKGDLLGVSKYISNYFIRPQ